MFVVLRGMQGVPMGYLGMVRGLLVISSLGMLCRLAVVLRRMLVVVRRYLMVFMDLMAIHCRLPG